MIECQLVDIFLNAYIGEINVQTNIRCFDGRNKRGYSNNIGKVLGFKNCVFKLYSYVELENFRSIWFHGSFDKVTGVYPVGFIKDTDINFISVETPKNLHLWYFRVRTLCNINFISVGEEVTVGQLVKILKFLKNGDYFTKGSRIIEDEDQIRVNQLRLGE
jgi:hypothetical protein